jgi:hypothetical protein
VVSGETISAAAGATNRRPAQAQQCVAKPDLSS